VSSTNSGKKLMHNRFQSNLGEEAEHPSPEMILLFVDGELSPKEASQLEAHLEACWPCRVRSQKIQTAIAEIIEFDEQVLTPGLMPLGGWRNFDRRLSQLVAASGKQSLSSRLLGSLGRFFLRARLSTRKRQFSFPVQRYAAATMALIMVAALIVYFEREPTVSANQLINNAITAQARLTHSTKEPVIHQTLRVRRKDQSTASEVNWEIWDDTTNSRVRQFLADGNQALPIPMAATSKSDRLKTVSGFDVINDFARVLETNQMDPQRPLSAASYDLWRNSLQRKQDEVTRSKLPNGGDALTLRTIPGAPVDVGHILEAVFVVRARDWQPTSLRLNVASQGGSRVYELTETVTEVLSAAQINPAIFTDQPIGLPTPIASPQAPLPKEMQPAHALAAKSQPLMVAPVATVELEVEALRLLNLARADLGEQIEVKRTTDGILQVSGIVETEQRKTEIIKALDPIASNPAVKIEVQTVAEALAGETPNRATPFLSSRQVEVASNAMAAEPELRAYFAGKGGDTDQAIRQYAARMVSLSGQGMDHLWALKRLLNQFSADQLRALPPESRAKWVDLIRAHADSFLQTNESLRRELQPVFFPNQPFARVASEEAVVDTNELGRLIESLFESGSSNDRVIRSAFTSSSDRVMTTVIRAPQYWQSLKNAEALARRIQFAR
jgi:Putative zinc-finger